MTDSAAQQHPYERLTPDLVLNAVESLGHACDGSLLALNSYENRVYQVGRHDADPLVAKFYRPERWSDAAIQEEHDFTLELAALEIPVVPPLRDATGRTLFRFEGFRFALFPRRGGRWPNLEDREARIWMGRFLGRIHACGASRAFRHRPRLTPQRLGRESAQWLLASGFIPQDLVPAWSSVVDDVLDRIEQIWDSLAGRIREIRLHGDCHPGNILWTDQGPHFVDFDDTQTGPAIQDLWMLLSGEPRDMSAQLLDYLEGYEDFCEFDPLELNLIEPLRTLRMLHYSAWLGRRWNDPAFPHNFPWYNTNRYWEEQVLALREQAAALNEPPISLY